MLTTNKSINVATFTTKLVQATCSKSSEIFVHEYSVPYHSSMWSVLPAYFLPITDILHNNAQDKCSK